MEGGLEGQMGGGRARETEGWTDREMEEQRDEGDTVSHLYHPGTGLRLTDAFQLKRDNNTEYRISFNKEKPDILIAIS